MHFCEHMKDKNMTIHLVVKIFNNSKNYCRDDNKYSRNSEHSTEQHIFLNMLSKC